MRNLKFIYVVLFIALFVFGGFFIGNPGKSARFNFIPTPTIIKEGFLKVTKVVDGDTIKVLIDSKEKTVRLIGIDTPEIVDPRKTIQCFGKEASEKAKELLSNRAIRLEADLTQGDKDKYGRLLRYVFLEDGTNFNKLMISEGFAHEYTYNSNPYKYQSEFIQKAKEAREENRGLWGSCPSNL